MIADIGQMLEQCANADNAILAFCNAGTVSDLGKVNAHHFSRFGVLPSGG
jgi:hypothetical protein